MYLCQCTEVCSLPTLTVDSSSAYFLPSEELIYCHSVLYNTKTIYTELKIALAR